MFARRIGVLVFFVCLPLWAQQAIVNVPGEPQNLNVVKQRLIQYHDCHESNCYEPQLEHQADVAIAFVKQSAAAAKSREKLAVVFDVDETALSNWSVEMLDDFGYIPSNENWCVSLHCARAIPATLRIVHEAEHDKIAVFFITGRPETQFVDTEANLRLEGYDHWQKLYARPVNHPASQSTADYKSGARADIVSQGYQIVLNVGDQLSDLRGSPMADHSVKMPNPFYYIP
ncbi:MAG: HAD family acid phosphatase [Candidatus Acidiferrales bacterium]